MTAEQWLELLEPPQQQLEHLFYFSFRHLFCIEYLNWNKNLDDFQHFQQLNLYVKFHTILNMQPSKGFLSFCQAQLSYRLNSIRIQKVIVLNSHLRMSKMDILDTHLDPVLVSW